MSYMYIVENDLEKFISDNFNQEEKIEISRINDYQKKSKRLRKKTVLQRNMEYRNTQKFDNDKALKRI